MFGRWIESVWAKKFKVPYVHIVFGARQTGKSTFLKKLLPQAALWLDFSHPAERSAYLRFWNFPHLPLVSAPLLLKPLAPLLGGLPLGKGRELRLRREGVITGDPAQEVAPQRAGMRARDVRYGRGFNGREIGGWQCRS